MILTTYCVKYVLNVGINFVYSKTIVIFANDKFLLDKMPKNRINTLNTFNGRACDKW